MTKEYRLAEIPMPELMDEDPRSAPPTVAAPKTESVGRSGNCGKIADLKNRFGNSSRTRACGCRPSRTR
jgi:hypothetical protein